MFGVADSRRIGNIGIIVVPQGVFDNNSEHYRRQCETRRSRFTAKFDWEPVQHRLG